MPWFRSRCWCLAALCCSLPLACLAAAPSESAPEDLSPCSLVLQPGTGWLFVACYTGHKVLAFDSDSGKATRSFEVGRNPSGMVFAKDSSALLVTTSEPESRLLELNTGTGQVSELLKLGHSATAPVLSADGQKLFVCERFNNQVTVVDLPSRKAIAHITVRREPVAAALTKDGRHFLVANHLPDNRADTGKAAAVVSIIDVASSKVVKELTLVTGSMEVNDVRVSPDGKYAILTHVLSRYHLPTTQLDRGWVNTNAGTLIDLDSFEIVNTFLLDNVDSGAANPWAAAWTSDGKRLLVTHAGMHEVSVIDFPGLLAKLAALPSTLPEGQPIDDNVSSRIKADVPNDLAFLVGLRSRIKLAGEKGPRALVLNGTNAWVANYFSDTLTRIDFQSPYPKPQSFRLGEAHAPSEARKGESLFHDATICFQGWQSCASCHPGDARVDGLNWDLLNDGIGNPKNTKSLLLAYKTPPLMSMGVRATAESAVRAGLRSILFTEQPESVGKALDEYLKSLKPVPSPYLVNGQLSEAAKRGQALFRSSKAGCADCHPPGLFTDLASYDVGTMNALDRGVREFDTPTLVEVWRTAPYLHDGSATNLLEVFTVRNKDDRHGTTSRLSPQELHDLIEYVLSL